ncbi:MULTISPECIES: HipA family kinase [Streptomyces]|uniref:HipA-like kinase domain-containing protein n=1 Tax=Streptomyces albus (strain ATCC 21838 / DSM 41398 / FERM P-419 / JCM 4703 / NBRC 107858) TaxID=1081613 RepID=A0A0B5F5V3_STRA4|nr:HipA family kinase [Streptomyces sp. SCSIO ZS0520]AJE86960.1 hypothetical protein SLNWT_6584 [Streptomyces albus]AOU81264.1 hypothetical protein SLNHY_6573 [Streptomyces albus]AYN36958.1 hypothetical protein DUI70_6465 [Streptomyces albus]
MLTEVRAARYAAPLREGGSLPGLVEGDDLTPYVMKFRGAGQGRKTLVAEVICGGLARRLGLRVPELVRMELDPVLGLGEPDEQVQELLKSSGGANLGMRFLPGALGFDPLAYRVDPVEAGRVLWFDALTGNVDRSWRNPNLLVWHGELWLIDHGATMIWHHHWPGAARAAERPYDASEHALASCAPEVERAAAELAPRITPELLAEVTAEVPDAWLEGEEGFAGPEEVRAAYAAVLLPRAAQVHRHLVLPEPAAATGPFGWITPPDRPDTGGPRDPGTAPAPRPAAGKGAAR